MLLELPWRLPGVTRHLDRQEDHCFRSPPQVMWLIMGPAVAGCLVQKGAALLLNVTDLYALQGRRQSGAQADSTVAGSEQRPGPSQPPLDEGLAAAEQSSQQHQSHAHDSATDVSRDHSGTETWSGSSSYSEANSQGSSCSDSGDDSGVEEGAGRPGSEEGAERGLVGALAGAGRQQGASAGRRALQLRLQGLALDNVDAVEPMKLMLQVGCSEGQVLALTGVGRHAAARACEAGGRPKMGEIVSGVGCREEHVLDRSGMDASARALKLVVGPTWGSL